MITTYFMSPTVIFWCAIKDVPYRKLATAINFDELAPYSPIQFGGI